MRFALFVRKWRLVVIQPEQEQRLTMQQQARLQELPPDFARCDS